MVESQQPCATCQRFAAEVNLLGHAVAAASGLKCPTCGALLCPRVGTPAFVPELPPLGRRTCSRCGEVFRGRWELCNACDDAFEQALAKDD